MDTIITNSTLISTIYDCLYSNREQLETKGITLKKFSHSFHVYFDLKKINQESSCVKYNVDGISVANIEANFTPDISLLRNNENVNVDEICLISMRLSTLFTCRELLLEILTLIDYDIGVVMFNMYNIIRNYEKEGKIFNKIIKDFEENKLNDYDIFKKNFKILKCHKEIMDSDKQIRKKQIDKFEKIQNDFTNNLEKIKNDFCKKRDLIESEQLIKYEFKYKMEICTDMFTEQKKQLTEKTLNIIREFENEIHHYESFDILKNRNNFIFDMLKVEQTLFSEIFNFISEETTLDKKTIYLKDNFIAIANIIHHYFQSFDYNLPYLIKSFTNKEVSCI